MVMLANDNKGMVSMFEFEFLEMGSSPLLRKRGFFMGVFLEGIHEDWMMWIGGCGLSIM